MEGPLTKWTNLVNGWQYRWFVLDANAGVLSYYTSLEKERKGDRRGCVKLQGSQVGIDDTEDTTFTITVDNKTFHFQARDTEERQKWLDALQEIKELHSKSHSNLLSTYNADELLVEFDRKIFEADAYLQILIGQEEELRKQMSNEKHDVEENILTGLKNLIEIIKQTIVCLQIAKQNSVTPLANIPVFDGISTLDDPLKCDIKDIPLDDVLQLPNGTSDCYQQSVNTLDFIEPNNLCSNIIPELSYSSSEDEFFDTQESLNSPLPKNDFDHSSNNGNKKAKESIKVDVKQNNIVHDSDYDPLYDSDEDELGSLQNHGSVITYLLGQLRIGMDLTKITLPTFILEKRSTLEMYADFIAHADLWADIPTYNNPKDRFVACVKWYFSAFHAGRKSSVAKKPYNPIIGEIFRCYYDISHSLNENIKNSKVKYVENNDTNVFDWAPSDSVFFIAEQVSHHPPVSAFYAEHKGKKICINGHLWTKSKFLGLSIGVEMIGEAVISLTDYDNEEYVVNFPSGYGRNILSVPWIELGGKCSIICAKTGYHAAIEFKTKPFYGGKKDQIRAECFGPNDKKPFMTVEGEWNDKMFAKNTIDNKTEIFVDVKAIPVLRKKVKPRTEQLEYESRRLWQFVTESLKNHNIQAATEAKSSLEQKQRDEAKYRKDNHIDWQLRCFDRVGENYIFKYPLTRRNKS